MILSTFNIDKKAAIFFLNKLNFIIPFFRINALALPAIWAMVPLVSKPIYWRQVMRN